MLVFMPTRTLHIASKAQITNLVPHVGNEVGVMRTVVAGGGSVLQHCQCDIFTLDLKAGRTYSDLNETCSHQPDLLGPETIIFKPNDLKCSMSWV